jgi:alcohol dehydrogenase
MKTSGTCHSGAKCYSAANNMQAVGITEKPEIGKVVDKLKMLNVPAPRPVEGEIVVKIAASSMHIDEIFAVQGTALGRFYGPKNVSNTNPYLIGSCAAGQIVGLGNGVKKFNIGDDVIIIPSEHPQAGSWTTYQCFEEKWLMHKPPQLTHV